MIDMSWKIMVQDLPGRYGKGIFIYRDLPNENIEVMASRDTIKTISRHESIEPTLILDHDTLRELADALNKKDFKPKEASFVEGKLQATESHLSDLRKILKIHKM